MTPDKIKHIRLYRAGTALEKPIADSTHTLTSISFLVLRLETASGISGESYLLSFQYSPRAIVGAVRDIKALAQQFSIWDSARFNVEANQVHEYFGQAGLLNWAAGLVNVAMWDARGKALSRPVHQLLGVSREKVPVYGSGGWLSYTLDELLNEVGDYVARGFKAVKIKVGHPNWKTDLERLKKVRDAVGPDVSIMMDANQGMQVPSACRLAAAAADLDIYWFEEPIHHQDFEGYRSIRQKCRIALAMGEREFDTVALRELLGRGAIDMWQPDLLRLGSVEAWLQSASVAAAHHIPVLPHYYKDYDVPLLCTIPNGLGAESFDWVDPLIDTPLVIRDGYAYPRTTPGWGFNFLDKHLEEITL